MSDKLYLIKEGEISLKGGNRHVFERKLRDNIREKFKGYSPKIERQKGRVYLYLDEKCSDAFISLMLEKTFGITGFARAYKAEKSIESIMEKAREILPSSPFEDDGRTFRIDCRREDKSFPLSSHEISIRLASLVHGLYPSLSVDLKNAEYTLYVEVRDDVYLYFDSTKGAGGLPVSTAGRAVLLLSGGIDSPVAAYYMAKRGVKLDCIYFHAYPYTSNEALEKVKKLASLIAPYLEGTRLYVVPFTEGQLRIKKKSYTDETTLMFRASMMQTAERIAKAKKATAIVTGEALSQVASQTLSAMNFTDSMTSLVVLRPLVGMDKEEIITVSKKIGTYETSILPYEDCCVIFSPKHPVTNPDKEESRKHYEALEMDEEIEKAIEKMQVFYFNARGEEEDKSQSPL